MTSNEYTYKVIYNEERMEWVAICKEFPAIQGLSKSSPALAFYSLYKTISEFIEDLNTKHSVRYLSPSS